MRRVKTVWRTVGPTVLVLVLGGTLMVLAIPGNSVGSIGEATPPYGGVPTSSPSRAAAIAAMEQLTTPGDVLNPRGVQITLGTSNLPSQDPVVRYMQALSNFSLTIRELQSDLQAAQTLSAAGNDNQALVVVYRLVELGNRTGELLDTMYNMLNVIQSEPNVNQSQIQTIRERLDGLRRLYTEYSIEIDQLKSQVTPRTVALTVSVPTGTVFVNQPINVSGRLETRNGTAMTQRNITVSWDNLQITTLTNLNGSYSAIIVFHPGLPNGTVLIGASFRPTGTDAAHFVTTNATALAQLEYYPTQIKAEMLPRTTFPLDSVTIAGDLTTSAGLPLENRTLQVQFDNNAIGNVVTTTNGTFDYNLEVPASASDGNHTLGVLFLPDSSEIYAAAIATLPLVVQRQQTQISTTLSSGTLLSGMSVRLSGVASLPQTTISNAGTLLGNVTIYLDGTAYASSTVGNSGAFSLTISIPLTAGSGTHSLRLEYIPADPQLDASTQTVKIHVYNSELVAVIGIGTVLAPLIVNSHRKRRLRVRSLGVPEPSEESLISIRGVRHPMTIVDWEDGLKAAKDEMNPRRKVVMCYRLAQNLIARKFDEDISDTETHWELYTRLARSKPPLSLDFKRLVELFELAEYSQYIIEPSYGIAAQKSLLRIKDAVWS